ncbi:SpaA isopeptide-forming pilin-related protein [Levilactobacillus lanxiensis]|uniref:SpaA isopeptide-forming pilin-related protein n=1 Tax=Levilactobacillus lanxiensis TaxID=2799568 RepID=A0ABW4D918_9LACO|nr:SpaA isopeptide-forming pilin-related protein [Levilactobacillus lanxiensis]
MKKLLAIIAVLGCVLGLTSYLRIQAQDRNDIIEKATLQDQTGRVVKKLTSHQAQDLQVALTVKLPAGETMVTLADQDNAKLMTGEITVDSNQEVTAMVDQKRQLIFKNGQSQDQTVDLVVPMKITPAPLSKDLQLKLNVADPDQEYELEKIAVVSKEAETTTEETKETTGEADAKLATETNDDTKKASDKTSDTKTAKKSEKKPTKKSVKPSTKKATTSKDSKTTKGTQSNQQTAGKTQSQKSATTDSEEDATEAEEDEAVQKRMATKQLTEAPPAVPTDSIRISRGQVEMEEWSKELSIGGTLLENTTDVELIKKELTDPNIKIDGYYGSYAPGKFDFFETHYHSSYHRKSAEDGWGGDGEIAYAVAIDNKPTLKATDSIIVYYPNVGFYTEQANVETPDQPMGAIVEISKIEYHNEIDGAPKNGRIYMDFSNNFYSGLVYKGIRTFDIDVTFVNKDASKALDFPDGDGDKYLNYFTFGSLNGNDKDQHEWAGTNSGLKGKLADGAFIENHDDIWYEGIGAGVAKGKTGDWGDYLGSVDYELGAVSFPMVGTKQPFMLRSDAGFTWQSFSSGYVMPLEQPDPQKTVHSTGEVKPENNDLDGVTIDRDEEDTDFLYYTIYQPTYKIPTESIAKPNAITMWDELPAGVTVNKKNIKLFNTTGERIRIRPRDITIEENGKVTYKLSKAEIEALTFNGDSFAIQMKVKLDSDFVGTLENDAEIEFNSGEKLLTWKKKTNRVITHYFRGTYQFEKIDSTTKKSLAGAEFIIQDKDDNYLKFDTNGKRTGEVADKNEATVLKGDDNGNFKITGLKTGTYTLIETKAPDGYTIGEPTKFTISSDKQTGPIESKQVENDPEYSLPITGGHGIIWFIIVGLMLILSALAIWRTHPRGG